MTHEDLIEIGFKLYGVEEKDSYYQITFRTPFKFGITGISGALTNSIFWLWANETRYSDKDELEKVIKFAGNEIYGK